MPISLGTINPTSGPTGTRVGIEIRGMEDQKDALKYLIITWGVTTLEPSLAAGAVTVEMPEAALLNAVLSQKFKVKWEEPGQEQTLETTDYFTLRTDVEHPMPCITSVSPLDARPNQLVRVQGENLDHTSGAWIGPDVASYTILVGTGVNVRVPSNPSDTGGEPVRVQLRVPNPNSNSGGTLVIRSAQTLDIQMGDGPGVSTAPPMQPPPASSIPPALQQNIIDDWQSPSMQGWINQLPQTVVGTWLGDVSKDATLDLCSLIPAPGGEMYTQDGEGTLQITDLSVASLDTATAGTPFFMIGPAFVLPIQVTGFQLSGRYGYSQPCVLWYNGHKGAKTEAQGGGRVTQTVDSGQLLYVLALDGINTAAPTLKIVDVQLNGNPSISVTPDGSGNDTIDTIMNFMGSDREQKAMEQELSSSFITASFSVELIQLLNAQLRAQTQSAQVSP